MAECRIVFTSVPEPGYEHIGAYDVPRMAEAYCETHNMKMEGPCNAESKCPIGRIEAAVQEGLAILKAAKE